MVCHGIVPFTGEFKLIWIGKKTGLKITDSIPFLLCIFLQHPPFVAAWKNLEKYWKNQETLFTPRNLNTDGHMEHSAYDTLTEEMPEYEDIEKIQEWTALYYALIEEVDEQVGRMLDQLGGDAENTLVIFTSDHGEVGSGSNVLNRFQPKHNISLSSCSFVAGTDAGGAQQGMHHCMCVQFEI